MRTLFYICVFLIAVSLGLLTFQAVMRPEPGSVAGRRGGTQGAGIPVEIASVTVLDLTDEGRFTGSILPLSQFTVAPKVAGRLKRLFVDIGDTIKSGQVVAELEDEEFVQAVAQAEAETAIARANVGDSQAQLDIARRELERVKAMRLQKVSSQAEVETAQAQYDSRVARHEVNKAQVTLKLAQVKAAQLRLSYTRVDAVWTNSGSSRFVGERFTSEGAMLSANSPIVSIYGLDPLIAVVDVVERDFFKIRIGQDARISVEALPGKSFPGKVVRISPVLNAATRQARVEVEIPNPGFVLKPGMFVTVDLQFNTHSQARTVPINALSNRKGVEGVFSVASGSRTATFVPVEKGITQGGLVEIASPTSISGNIVTLGQHLLEEGASVILPGDVKETPSESAGGAGEGKPRGKGSRSKGEGGSGKEGITDRPRGG